MKHLHPGIFTFLPLLFISILSFGQSDTYRLTELITTDDGLSHNYVNCLEKYENGLILLGTDNGFLLFDGYDFQLFNSDSTSRPKLNHHSINSIAFDLEKNIWIGSNNGINKVNPFQETNELFLNLENEKYPPLKNEQSSRTLLTSTSDGKIWIINDGIICQIVEGKVNQYFPEKYSRVTKIENDGHNNIYALTNKYLIGISLEGKLLFEIDQFSSPLFGIQKRENISNLFQTKSGEVILEDFTNNRFFKINPSGKIEDITSQNHWLPRLFEEIDRQVLPYNIKSIKKLDILETNHNLIWVATNFGLVKMEVKHDFFENIPELNGVSLRKIIEGSNGIIYGGTYPPSQFFRYNSNNKKFKWIENNQDVTDMISINQDSILVIARNGNIRIFSQSKQKVIGEVKSPEGAHFTTAFLDENNTIWFAGRKKNFYQSSLFNPLDFSAVKMKDGDIVINSLIWGIYPIDKKTFLLASENGVIMYDKKEGTQLVFNEKSPDGQKVINNIIEQVLKDEKGNVWIASDGGLNYLDVKARKITKEYSTKNGLSNNHIYSAVMESDSILWLGTANGLSRLNIETESFTNFYLKEGIADNEFNLNSALKSSNGKIFMGGMRGVTLVKSKKIVFEETPSKHFVVSYQKYNSSTGLVNQFYLNTNQIEPIYQKANESFIEIKFVNEDFTSPRRNTFTYKLEGLEKNWQPKTRNNSVRYSNLEAGDYIFKLKSANANGVESNYIFEVPIIVEQYFYKSKWFMILISSILLAALLGFFQYRLYRYRKTIELRNKLARDLHDEMSNSFNNIRIIAKEGNPEDIDKTTADLYHIHHMSSEAIEMVEDVIWSLNRNNNTVGDVIMKMEDFLDDVLKSKNIPFTFEKFGIDEEGKLNYLYRRNLLLIFKEAITNTIKHSKPLHVHIIFKNQPKTFHFQITNVFDELVQAKYSTGLGIPGMRQRAEFINATLEIKKAKHQFDVVMIMKKVKKKGRNKK